MVLKGWIGQSSGFIGQAFKAGNIKGETANTDDTKHHKFIVNNLENNKTSGDLSNIQNKFNNDFLSTRRLYWISFAPM